MKKIRKILPLSTCDIPGIERWLEGQANDGLFPVSVGSWVTFTPDGVPGTRFRLEPYGKSGTEPTEEQLELYHSAGWEYALTVGSVYFLFYTTDPAAVDFYSDNESAAYRWNDLKTRRSVRSEENSSSTPCWPWHSFELFSSLKANMIFSRTIWRVCRCCFWAFSTLCF